MNTKKCIAMVLAGGRGMRLGALTHFYSKPAIYFGGNHRIIDYTLCNCHNAGIDTIGILSQYFTTDLQIYIDTVQDSIQMLPSKNSQNPYMGTADAVYKNIAFLDKVNPANVLILSGDHIYKMDYREMLTFHEEMGADVTVASTTVPINEASQFGILNAEKNGHVSGFEEKPLKPKSDLASMGIYIFKWNILRKYLLADSKNRQSHHDFGKDIIPQMLFYGESVYTYQFNGYWRDVGTLYSLWKANMDQITNPSTPLFPDTERDMAESSLQENPNMISSNAVVRQSIVSGGCSIFGKVEHSVLSHSVTIGHNTEIVNSVIMPNTYIGDNVKIHNAIVGTRAAIMGNTVIGAEHGVDYFVDRQMCSKDVSLVAPWLHITGDIQFQKNSHIYADRLEQYNSNLYKRVVS